MKKNLHIFLCFLIHYGLTEAEYNSCGPGVTTAGYTYPQGDITLKYGDNLDITCVLKSNESARLYGSNDSSQFMRYVIGNTTLPVDKINSTAIKIHIDRHPKTNMIDYYCMINDTLVCHNIVVVGTAPEEITDFDCLGLNNENFTCTWTPGKNFVKTDYQLEYAPINRPTRFFVGCPHKITLDPTTKKMWCTWAISTVPPYRHSHDGFIFALRANNTFGKKIWNFSIDHYSRVRPNPPEKFTAGSISPHEIKLRWSLPLFVQSFPPGLDFRVSWLIDQYKNWTTILVDKNDLKIFDDIFEYVLRDLPYSHFLYDIRLAIKSRVATEERMWSQNASNFALTLSKIPDVPPKTVIGSFELVFGTRNKRIYWQPIHDYQENGANFTYNFETIPKSDYQPMKLSNNYAEFENLPDQNFTFKIWSNNTIGRSENFSEVFIPAQRYRIKNLANIVKEDRGNGEYGIQWVESRDPRVTSYTLFYCSSKRERPHVCEGNLEWEMVPRGVERKTLKLPIVDKRNNPINIYQFAIAANGFGTSSGLLWARCTIIPGTGVKLGQTYIKISGSRYFVLQWKVECIKLDDIKSFNVTYCKTTTPQSQICVQDSLKYKLFENEKNRFSIGEGELNITDLKPYSTYKIFVTPIVNGSDSLPGDPMVNTTSEEAPTEPRHLKVLNISDRTINIYWEKPAEENGLLNRYIVISNGEEIAAINVEKENPKTNYTYELIKLLPRTKYNITVGACTSACTYSTLQAFTDIGVPGEIEKPSANWNNLSLIIKWSQHDEPEVAVDYYEVLIGTVGSEETPTTNTTTKLQYEINKCQEDHPQTVYVQIRGVNIKEGRKIYGKWTERGEFPTCAQTQSPVTWLIVIMIVVGLSFITGISFAFKISYHKFRSMRNCPVKLPPGLDATVNISDNNREQNTEENLPGEPLLPGNNSTDLSSRNRSVESSGHGSGAASVTSSVESSERNISLSDSGTDQPKSPTISESEPTPPQQSSDQLSALRQRPNVKKVVDYVAMNELPQGSWTTKKFAQTAGYSVVGLNSPLQQPPAPPPPPPSSSTTTTTTTIIKPDFDTSSYLPLNKLPIKKSSLNIGAPQTLPTSETVKNKSISGYIPYLTQEPASKNTPYVLAGTPTNAATTTTTVFSENKDKKPSSASISAVAAPTTTTTTTDATKKFQLWETTPIPISETSSSSSATGYVIVGDTIKPQKTDLIAPTSTTTTKGKKGYVPHHHNLKFDSNLKED